MYTSSTSSAFSLPTYAPARNVMEVLVHGAILSEDEKPQDLLERTISTLFSVEEKFGTQAACTQKMARAFAEYMVEGYVMPGTPALTNAGRHNMALSSCAIIPVDLQTLNKEAAEHICSYYQQNMGSGFQFTNYKNPVAILTWLNDLSARETATGTYERYIGNMGLLHIAHPRIQEFIEAKRFRNMRHFNISVDVTEDFMHRAAHDLSFTLSDGTEVDAAELLQQMAENAWCNGDPGLIFLERMNRDNALECMSRYVSTPPCAEMGMAEGETSQFGYLNLHRFLRKTGKTIEIDYDKLKAVTELLTRVLDNAIEYSLPRYPAPINAKIARMKRKMGIGVCGLADMLIALKLPYDTQEARDVARDVLSFINYTSKCASVALAHERGSCQAMNFPLVNKYINGRFLEDKYMPYPTRTVSAQQWEELATTIRVTRKLRNIATTALPPTGRSSILLDASSSIEPLFSIFTSTGNLHTSVSTLLQQEWQGSEQMLQTVQQAGVRNGSFQAIESLPTSLRNCLKTAKEIAPLDHLRMVADLAGIYGVIDESASKTVNLPHTASVADIQHIFLSVWQLGLKNISIYRDKTFAEQPMSI